MSDLRQEVECGCGCMRMGLGMRNDIERGGNGMEAVNRRKAPDPTSLRGDHTLFMVLHLFILLSSIIPISVSSAPSDSSPGKGQHTSSSPLKPSQSTLCSAPGILHSSIQILQYPDMLPTSYLPSSTPVILSAGSSLTSPISLPTLPSIPGSALSTLFPFGQSHQLTNSVSQP